jgi:hypothetical protein
MRSDGRLGHNCQRQVRDHVIVLDSWERFQAERSLAQRVAGAVTDDPDTIEQYFGYARQGRATVYMGPTPNSLIAFGSWPRSSPTSTHLSLRCCRQCSS